VPYDILHRSTAQDAVLDRVIDAAENAADGAIIALDLDGCLFDNRPRQLRIARAWAERRGDCRLAPLKVEHFQDWSFSATLQRMGLPADEADALAADFRPHWERWFFADDFVMHDLPLPGASRFVRRLQEAGSRVIYLTGRTHAQRPSTLANLSRYGFPIDPAGDGLWTKPTGDQSDSDWKRFALETLVEEGGRITAFLDNEPTHLVHALDEHPQALLVWLRTDHSPRAVRVPESMPSLRGFLRTSDRLPGDAAYLPDQVSRP